MKEEVMSLFLFPYWEISVSTMKAVQSEISELSNIAYRECILHQAQNGSHIFLTSRMKNHWFFTKEFRLHKIHKKTMIALDLYWITFQVKFVPHPAVFTYKRSIYIVRRVNIFNWILFYRQITSLASTVPVFKIFPFLKILKHTFGKGTEAKGELSKTKTS